MMSSSAFAPAHVYTRTVVTPGGGIYAIFDDMHEGLHPQTLVSGPDMAGLWSHEKSGTP